MTLLALLLRKSSRRELIVAQKGQRLQLLANGEFRSISDGVRLCGRWACHESRTAKDSNEQRQPTGRQNTPKVAHAILRSCSQALTRNCIILLNLEVGCENCTQFPDFENAQHNLKFLDCAAHNSCCIVCLCITNWCF